MARNTDDAAYRKAQTRLTRQAAEQFQRVDSGREDPASRRAYDRELRRTMPVNGKGRRTR